MVEKELDKDMGTQTKSATAQQTVPNTSQSAQGTSHRYAWMLEGEQVIATLPVRYALVIGSVHDSIIGPSTSRVQPKKVKVKNIVATNYRLAYLDKSGELFTDKRREKLGRNGRQFFFYNKDAVEKYLFNVIKHNEQILEEYKKQNPKFADYYNKKHAPGKFSKKLFHEGYLTSVYLLDDVAEATEARFKKGSVNKGIIGTWAVNKTSSRNASFVDRFRHGFALNGIELYLPSLESNKFLHDTGKNFLEGLTTLSVIGSGASVTRKAEFYIRPSKASAEQIGKLISSIMDDVVELRAYKDKKFIAETYQNLARKDKP
jgi:hypothetical protein